MVKEERWVIDGPKLMWNIPRSGAGNNENTQEVAQRELMEETGISLPLKDFIFMANICPENGAILNNSDIYMVKIPDSRVERDVHKNDETVATKRFSHEDIARMVATEELTDAWTLTVLGLTWIQKR